MLDFTKLKRFKEREFVPDNADLTDLSQISELVNKLLGRQIDNKDEFEKWILDKSELEAAVDQASSALYINMTCHTDDKKIADEYTRFITEVSPELKNYEDKLNRKFVEILDKVPLDENRYGIYSRSIKSDIELFREENIPLETKESLLSQKYQKICAAMTVVLDGQEITLQQAGKHLLSPDRRLRESAWKAIEERRSEDKDALDKIFDEMVKIRHQIALNAGFKNYSEYKFKELHRFDYTIDDCKEYHSSVEKFVVPIMSDILRDRKTQMKVEKLRPWDTSADPMGRDPLKPFSKVNELVDGCLEIFERVDKDISVCFEDMKKEGLLELESRKGKAPGGYQSSLSEARKPFIFMNAVGVDNDVRTLLHEGGHAFHTFSCAKEPLLEYRHAPMEFCEVASMSMELLGAEYLSVFYNESEVKRSQKSHLESVVSILVWVAIVDSFQHWIYENPGHSREERKNAWMDIRKRFGNDVVDWSGFEKYEQFLWHRQLHIFEVPFYYIEYAIAQLGALQVWLHAKENKREALEKYKYALSFGGAKGLKDLFQDAGISFDMSGSTISPVMQRLKTKISSFN